MASAAWNSRSATSQSHSYFEAIRNPPPGAPVPPILPPQDGYLFLDRARFAASFAADVAPSEAAFMADSQVPWGLDALNGAVTLPAWKAKPSWYLVATDDKMIPPDAQRAMSKRAGSTVTESRAVTPCTYLNRRRSRPSSRRRHTPRPWQRDRTLNDGAPIDICRAPAHPPRTRRRRSCRPSLACRRRRTDGRRTGTCHRV